MEGPSETELPHAAGPATDEANFVFDRFALPAVLAPSLGQLGVRGLRDGTPRRVGVAPAGTHGLALARALRHDAGVEVSVFDGSAGERHGEAVLPYAAIRGREFDSFYIAVANETFAREIRETVQELLPPGAHCVNLLDGETRFLPVGALLNAPIERVSEGQATAFEAWRAGRPVVVVVAGSYFSDVTTKIRALLDAGFAPLRAVVGIGSDMSLERGEVRLETYLALRKFGASDSDVVYVVVNVFGFALLRILRGRAPDLPIVAMSYDWLSLFCPARLGDLRLAIAPTIASQFALEDEAEGLMLAGGIVDLLLVKDDAPRIEPLRGARVAWVEHRVIPVPDDLDAAPCEALGDPLRMVFLGTLVVPASAPAAFFDDVFLAPLFRSVASQGLTVRVFYGRGEHACAADVRTEIGTSVSVEVEEGAPIAELVRGRRVRGDFGWMLYDSDFTNIRPHIRATIPSKLYAYAALGLAIAVSEELEAVAELVERWKMGVVVPRGELGRVAGHLRAADGWAMKNNAQKFLADARANFSSDRFVGEVKRAAAARRRHPAV